MGKGHSRVRQGMSITGPGPITLSSKGSSGPWGLGSVPTSLLDTLVYILPFDLLPFQICVSAHLSTLCAFQIVNLLFPRSWPIFLALIVPVISLLAGFWMLMLCTR